MKRCLRGVQSLRYIGSRAATSTSPATRVTGSSISKLIDESNHHELPTLSDTTECITPRYHVSVNLSIL